MNSICISVAGSSTLQGMPLYPAIEPSLGWMATWSSWNVTSHRLRPGVVKAAHAAEARGRLDDSGRHGANAAGANWIQYTESHAPPRRALDAHWTLR